MLILHRKRNEVLCIGDSIRVVVLEVDSHGVRLGIEAPPQVTILREEIRIQVEEENRRASLATAEAVDLGAFEDLLGGDAREDTAAGNG